MRRIHFSLVFCCLAALVFSAPLLAQAPPAYPGAATAFPSSYGDAEPGPSAVWDVEGPGVSGNPSGWNVTYRAVGHTLTITVPAGLPASSYGSYTASYVTGHVGSADNEYTVGYTCSFQVVAAPPTLPPAGNPAFSWQGSVAGVNTGNGNKTTTLPIVGWTQRGGMGVSCALYHNSQGVLGGTYGYKWNPSYLTYITPGPGSGVTLHWDNGLTYSATNAGGTLYTLPYGILDTLNSTGSGTFTMKTPSQTVYTFGFAPNGTSGNAYLSKITDLDGNTLTINHNSDGTLSNLVDSTSRTLTYGYSGGHLTTITDPLGRVWSFNASGSYLQTVQLPPVNGQTYSLFFGYGDGRQNITQFMDARGNSSLYTYNGNNSLATAKDPVGNTTTFTYNPTNTVITDPNGHTTTHTYNASRLASVTDALNYSSSTYYDYNNITTQTTDKRGYAWRYLSHFTSGNATSTSTDPLNYTTSSTYDAENKVIGTTDAVGNVTASTYSTDGKEDLLTTSVTGTGSYPFKATSKVGGYAYGLPTTFTDPLGYGSSVGYDGNGYPNSATDANGNKSTAVYNALGWKTSSTDAASHTTTYTYDNWGRVTAVTAPDNTKTTTTYDPNGNVLTITDADNHTVTNVYDGDNRLTQTTNGRGDVVKYAYDGADPVSGAPQKGLLSSKTDGNNHTTYYSYTARNEPSATFYPDGTSESVTYDADGNTVSRTKADGKVIKYAYDADNRLTDITYPTLHATHFDYDADGRRIDMTDATGTTSWGYTYDGVHLSQLASPGGCLSYVYDGDGRLSSKYINVNNVLTYWYNGYDAGGRLTSLRSTLDGTTTYTYNPDDTLATKTFGNGNYDVYGYDACAEVTGIGYYNPGGNYQNGLSYSYDPAGNRTFCNQNWYTTTYAYDGANQLVSETSGGGSPPPTIGYTYDHNGNRLTQSVNGNQVQSFTYDAHDKLVSGTAGNETDTYDKNGSETSITLNGSVYRFSYDDEDRLVQGVYPGATDTFLYNGLGLRVGKTDSTGTYSYLCDGASPGADVLWDGHAIYTPGLSENRGGVSSYGAYDVLGNLWFVDNGSGQQTYYQDTSAFGSGQNMGIGGTEAGPFKFGGGNGCQTDGDIGLILMGHRYYDTRIGRFISQDHAKSGGNWYEYASNNPMNKTDPSGMSDGLPGSLGAPDSHYGGLGGFLDGGAEGLNSLDSFWDSENASEVRGSAEYAASVAISRAIITGPPSFQSYVKNLLNQIASSQFGAQLLADSLYTRVLKIAPLYGVPNSEYHGIENKFMMDGTYNTILFNPSLVVSINTADGPMTSTHDGILEHEIGHDVGGLGDPSYDQNIYDTNGVDNISQYENPYRQELGQPIRLDHSSTVLQY